jgi:VWFA-related protein
LFGDEQRSKRGRAELDELVARTGGLASYPAGVDDIEPAAIEIAHEIRSQYTIAYAPSNQALDGSYRSIRVTANGPGKLSVRTRAGYVATGDP